MSRPFRTLTVSPGVELGFLDSGAPASNDYITIFAIHGMCFNANVFKRIQAKAFSGGYRFVSINRRPFIGSTAFNEAEIRILTGVDTSEDNKAAFMEARGHELATFIDIFTQTYNLPPRSSDGERGGNVLFGWSLGTQFACSALAYITTLPPDVQARFSAHLRSFILYDTSPSIMGLPDAPDNWAPLIDTSVPESLRLPMFGQWVTSYFDNGDYSKGDFTTLAYVLPSIDRPPSIFNMSVDEQRETLAFGQEASFDLLLFFFLSTQLKTTFEKAFETLAQSGPFSHIKKAFIVGDRSPSFAITGLWSMKDSLKSLGQDNIDFHISSGSNHFMHWDDPDKTLKYIVSSI